MATIVTPLSAVSSAETPAGEAVPPANPWPDEPQTPAIAGLPPGFTPIGEEAKKLADTAESSVAAAATDSAAADVEAAFGQPHSASDAGSRQAAQLSSSEPADPAHAGQPEPTSAALSDVEAAFGPPKPAADPRIPSIAPPVFATEFNIPAASPTPEPGPEAEDKPASGISIPSIAPPTFATEFNIPAVTPTDSAPDADADADADVETASSQSAPSAPVIPSIAPPTFATEFNIPAVTPTDSAPDADADVETAPAAAASAPSAPVIPSIAPPTFATEFNIPAVTPTDSAPDADTGADTKAETAPAAAPSSQSTPSAPIIPSIAPPTFATEFNVPAVTPPDSDRDEAAPAPPTPSSAPAVAIPSIAPPTFATEFNIPAVTADRDNDRDTDADAELGETAPTSRPGPAITIPKIADPAFATGFGLPAPPLTDPTADEQPVAPPPGFNPDLDTTARTDTSGVSSASAPEAPSNDAWSPAPAITPNAPTVMMPTVNQANPAAGARPATPPASTPSTPPNTPPTAPPASPVNHAPPIPPHLQQPMTPPKSFTAHTGASTYQPPSAPPMPPSAPPMPPSGSPAQASAPAAPAPAPAPAPSAPSPTPPPASYHQPPPPAHMPPVAQHPNFTFPTPPQPHQPHQPYQQPQPHQSQPQPSQQTPPSHMTVVPLPPSMQSPYGAPDRTYPAGPKPTLHDTDSSGWSRNKRIGVIAGAAVVVVAGVGGTIFALSGGGDSPKPAPTASPVPPVGSTSGADTSAPVTSQSPTAQPSTSQAAAGPIGAAQGEAGAKDVVLRGLYGAAADRDFKTVCASQTAAAQKGAAKGAGWNGTGDPAPLCEKYFQDNWSKIDAGYLRGRKVTGTKPGPNATTMLVTVDDAPPNGAGSTRTFTVVWSNNRWLLEASKA